MANAPINTISPALAYFSLLFAFLTACHWIFPKGSSCVLLNASCCIDDRIKNGKNQQKCPKAFCFSSSFIHIPLYKKNIFSSCRLHFILTNLMDIIILSLKARVISVVTCRLLFDDCNALPFMDFKWIVFEEIREDILFIG